jgi:hypothetical protein
MSSGALLSVFLLGVAPVSADHVLSERSVQATVTARAESRAASLSVVEGALQGSDATRAIAILGTDRAQLRKGLDQMSDAEVADLAKRVSALKADPRAGLTEGENSFLVIFLVVATVLIVLAAVD